MIRNVILKFAAALLAAVFAVGDAEAEGFAPINPAFLKWRKERHCKMIKSGNDGQRSRKLLAAAPQTEEGQLGLAPSVFDSSYLANLNVTRVRGVGVSYPPKYDLREKGWLTPIRNQNPYGTCWAFATYSSLESSLLKFEGSAFDFSENNLANRHSFDWGFDDGGNADMSSAYLLRWEGPILESSDPYPNPDGSSPMTPVRHVQNVPWIPGKTTHLDNDGIKEAVIKYGALWVGYYHENSCYNSSHQSYYFPYSFTDGRRHTNHAVAIVGWDDNFSRYNFNRLPDGDGAFIVRNNWGDSWGDDGYFYVSYYDETFAWDVLYSFSNAESTENYDAIYQYDPLGKIGAFGYRSATAYGAVRFIATNDLPISAVGFYALVPVTVYTIQVYVDCSSDNPSMGTKAFEQSGKTDRPGFVTVPLLSPVSIGRGRAFSIVLKLVTSGYNYPLACEYSYTDPVNGPYSTKASASPGETFLSPNGSVWKDFYEVDGTASFCCKAYAKMSAPTKELSSIAISGASSLTSGKTWQFTSKAKYSNGAEEDVTDKTTWSIAEGRNYASISGTGLVEAKEVTEQQTVRVHAKYTEDGVSKEDDWSFYVTVAAPKPPTELAATEGTDASCIRVNWTAPSGASKYSIYRSPTDQSKNAIFVGGEVTATRYSDTDEKVVPGVDYWYFVKAINASGTSGYSTGVKGWRKLAAPENVSATDGASLDNVTITWSEVRGASHYRVYRSEDLDDTPIAIGSWQSERKFVDNRAKQGVTYYYYVAAAVDADGNRPSDQSIFDDGFRAVPVTLDFIAINGESSIPSGGNATYTCTATYTDKSDKPVSATWEIVSGADYVTLSGATLTAKAVMANQTVVLKATYTDGVTRINTKEITITAVKPSAPSSVRLKGETFEAVTIGWAMVANAASYSVWRGISTADRKRVADALTGNEYADRSGDPGVTYTYWVKASNAAGESDFSAASASGTRTLSAPIGVSASDGTYTDKTVVTWKPVAGATHYRVARAETATGAKTELGSWQAATTYEDKDGTAGKRYWYFVKAATSSAGANASAYGTGDEGWRKVPVTLVSITINGPVKLAAGKSAVLSCDAIYSNGTTNLNIKAEWSASGAGTIDAGGKLTANAVAEDSTVTVTARYTDGTTKSATHTVSIIAPIRATAEVKNVKASARWPFSGKLDVDYELDTKPEGTRAVVTLSGHDDDHDVAMAAKTLSGEGAEGAILAGKHRITWDVAADYPHFHVKSFSVEMSAVPILIAAPSNLTASVGTSTKGVDLAWAAVDEATGYEVWRGTSSSTNTAELIKSTEEVAYSDTTAAAGTTYYYWVRSVGEDGKSDFGKPVCGARAYADITVSFNGNGGTPSYSSKTYSPTKAYDSLPTASRTGYQFAGWYTASSGGSQVTTSSTVPTAATTLWAHWTANTYWISFNANGGSGSMSNLSMTYDVSKNLTANAFALTGYSFIGWATTSGGSVVYGNGASVKNLTTGNGSTVTLYAKWQANIPSAPTGVSATDGQAGSVTVSWSAVSIATSYEIWRNTSSSTLGAEKIGTSTTTGFTDTTAPINTTCYYWVKAVNAMGTSGWSSYDSGYRVLGAPTNVSASDNTLAVGVRITWDAVDGADSYAIYRGTSSSSGSATQIGTSMGPAYIDSEVVTGTTYYYFIKATASGLGVTSAFSAYDAGSRKAGEPLYVVVDLSGGTTAANYPISELNAAPSGGWTDEYKTNKLVLRRIANGTFTMGSPLDELGHDGSNEDLHQVTISKPFIIGVFEITQKQYELVMGETPSRDKGDARPVESVPYEVIRGSLEGAKRPSAHTVDSTSFMGKIRARTGLTLDLPTEAQWEYACRAGTTTALNSGKNLTNTSSDANMAEVGRYDYNESDGKGGYSSAHTTVGSYLANNWGLYDMHGNVNEWCLDWYTARLGSLAVTDPVGESSEAAIVIVVTRGGNYARSSQGCRSACRDFKFLRSDNVAYIGFRLCCPAGLMLAPPTGVSATDGTSATGVTVTWNSVSGATSYNIWRGVHNASGAAEKIGTVTGTSYTDSNAVAGTQYWYWVEAVNGSYSSGFTAWDTGYRKLGSPSGVSATAGTGANTISWSAVADATSYKILRGTSSTYSSATQIGTVTTATYSDATALPGQGYYYWIVAVNDQGESAPSSYVYTSGWQLAAPTGVSASDGTYYDKVVISWGAVTGASTYYIYRYTSNSSGSASQIGSSTTTSYEDKTAVAGTTYYYWVKAYNADSGAYSAFSAVDSGSRKKLSTPSGVSATAGAGANNLTWSTVADATSYKILRGTSSTYSSATQIGTVTTATFSDATALPGQGYYYWIVAVNDQGESAPSSYAYTSGWQLAAPTGVNATDTATNDVTITWNAVSGATSYEIWRSSYSYSPDSYATKIGTSTTTSYIDTTVPAASTYYYYVKAVNAAGASGWSSYNSGYRVRVATGLTIEGPESMPSGCSGAYKMKLVYSDGTQSDVTSSSYVTWSIPTTEFVEVSSSYTSDSEHGYYRTLTAKTVTSLKQVVVTAKYNYNGTTVTDTLTVSITPPGSLAYSYRLWPDGTGSLTDYLGSDKTTVTSLSLPSSINGVTIRGTIGEWMQKLSSLTSVTIPSTFETLSYNIFYRCNRLTSVSIPNSVTQRLQMTPTSRLRRAVGVICSLLFVTSRVEPAQSRHGKTVRRESDGLASGGISGPSDRPFPVTGSGTREICTCAAGFPDQGLCLLR